MDDLQSIQHEIAQLSHDRVEFAKSCKLINDDYNQKIAVLESKRRELIEKTGANVCPNCSSVVSYRMKHRHDNDYETYWRCPHPLNTIKIVLE